MNAMKLLVMVNFLNDEQKTLPAARRPAALETFSCVQDLSGYHNFINVKIAISIDFGVDNGAVRAAEGH